MVYPKIMGSILLVFFGALELVLRRGAVAKSFSAGDEDHGSTRLLVLVWIPAVAALFTAGFGPRLPPWVQWLGIVIGSGGILLRIVAFRTLGEYYTRTLVTVTGQGVVRRGPYRFVRHPGYLSALLIWVGAAASFGFLLPPSLELVLLIPVYVYRIGIEERMLLKNLGSDYAAYRAHSWRLVPFVF